MVEANGDAEDEAFDWDATYWPEWKFQDSEVSEWLDEPDFSLSPSQRAYLEWLKAETEARIKAEGEMELDALLHGAIDWYPEDFE